MIRKILTMLGILKPLEILDPTSGLFAASIAASEQYAADVTEPAGRPKFYQNGPIRLPYFEVPEHLQ
jgi:hypothetical protein